MSDNQSTRKAWERNFSESPLHQSQRLQRRWWVYYGSSTASIVQRNISHTRWPSLSLSLSLNLCLLHLLLMSLCLLLTACQTTKITHSNSLPCLSLSLAPFPAFIANPPQLHCIPTYTPISDQSTPRGSEPQGLLQISTHQFQRRWWVARVEELYRLCKKTFHLRDDRPSTCSLSLANSAFSTSSFISLCFTHCLQNKDHSLDLANSPQLLHCTLSRTPISKQRHSPKTSQTAPNFHSLKTEAPVKILMSVLGLKKWHPWGGTQLCKETFRPLLAPSLPLFR